jgi:general secretion pathway protein G
VPSVKVGMNRKQKIAIAVGVVVTVPLGLALLALAIFVDRLRSDPILQAHFQVAVFDSQVGLYRAKHGRLPADLQALADPGTFVEPAYPEGVPNDPWGNPYEYDVLSDTEYQVFSRGEDGQESTEDDVAWRPEPVTTEAARPSDPVKTLVVALVATVVLTLAAVVVLKERKG